MFRRIVSVFSLFFYLSAPASAADALSLESQVLELKQAVQDLKLIVDRQSREIAELRGGAHPPHDEPAAAGTPAPRMGRSTGRWNPDIGVIADTLLTLDSPKEDAEGADRISVRELEFEFGSNVDPFTRLDATLAISDFEEMQIEEAYATRFGLPLDAKARIGRIRPLIGKVNPMHLDMLDTVDEPLVIQRWFGHHGLSKTGADITVPLNIPWDASHDLTVGVLEGGNGEEGTAFGESRRNPTVYSRLKNYVDLTDSTGLEVGVNGLTGSRDDDEEFDVMIAGLDGTLIHRYADRRHVKLQSEGYFMEREDAFSEAVNADTGEIDRTEFADNLWGAYLLADWRFDPQWAAGARYDYVELVDNAVVFPIDGDDQLDGADESYSVYLTFHQSEFARWRLQYTYVDPSDGNTDNRVYVQGTFAIGEHKHKLK